MGGDSELNTHTGRKERKKRKKEKDATSITIETVQQHPEKTPPLVGYFPSGFDPNKRTESRPDPPSVRVYRHGAKPQRMEVVVSPVGDSAVDFVGKTHEGEAAVHKMCSYAVGVFDRESQRLRIVRIAADKIFRLEPVVRGVDVSDKTPLTPATAAEKYDKIRDLTNAYGTSRAKSRVQKALQLKIKDDASSQPELEKQLDESIDKDALASTSAETTRNIPPYDLSATTPEAAYPLDKIIFTGDWPFLLDIWELCQAKEEITPEFYSSFVCSRFGKLDNVKDESEKEKLACMLSFLNHLIKFKDRYSMDGHSSSKNHKFPSILSQRFSSMFINSEKNRLSDDKISLLISYVLVLTLYIDNFETIPEDISKDLKMSQSSLKVHYVNLGCKYKRRNNVNVAVLPVPLTFLVMNRRRQK